jgi:hypothetical protein
MFAKSQLAFCRHHFNSASLFQRLPNGKNWWGRSGEVREKVEGQQQFTRGVENTNMTDCISSLETLLNTSKENDI